MKLDKKIVPYYIYKLCKFHCFKQKGLQTTE